MLEGQRPGVEDDEGAVEPGLAGPGVVGGRERELLDGRPVLDRHHAVVVHAPPFEDRAEVVGDGDDAVGLAEEPGLQAHVVLPDEAADDGHLVAQDPLGGDADDVLEPEHEPGAGPARRPEERGLGVERGVGREDHVRPEVGDVGGRLPAELALLPPARREGVLLERGAERDRGDLEPGRVVGEPAERPPAASSGARRTTCGGTAWPRAARARASCIGYGYPPKSLERTRIRRSTKTPGREAGRDGPGQAGWRGRDLNSRPHDYESCALTS